MLVLDLKTVPDAAIGKRLLALEKFSDAEAELAMRTLRVAGQQATTAPTHQRRVVAAALVVASATTFAVETFDVAVPELDLLTALEARVAHHAAVPCAWDAARSYRAQLLSRALALGSAWPALLRDGGPSSLAGHFGFTAAAPLAELAAVHGLPHRLGLRGAEVEAAHRRGDDVRLAAGAAADALMAYLVGLALRGATGECTAEAAWQARQQVRGWLSTQTAAHWQAFHAAWRPA